MPTSRSVTLPGYKKHSIRAGAQVEGGVYLFVCWKSKQKQENPILRPQKNPYNPIYIYMAMSQNCVWNVPRCSGRMERRGFVTGLVPDLWNVMKYKLCININICILYICVIYVYIITSQGYAR